MANLERDYLSVYKTFFDEFAATMNPDDQLPVKVGGYCLCDTEVVGEIVDWILQYLNQKRCPSSLVAPLAKIVLGEIRQAMKKQPSACGFRREENVYQPLKLMQVVTGKVNDVCLRYLNPECLESLSPPTASQLVSVCAIKNSRRRMEDRHTIIEDFHSVFDVDDQEFTNYYAVFDGHAGTDAAVYGVSHLHQFLAESPHYPSDPERALRDAFHRTDEMFLEKSNRENLRSGTTALCALFKPRQRMLYIAWLGDSQALLVSRGVPLQLVNPHKPDRQDERERIESMGGCVMYWGTWRVNGQLAVSRAIGDLEYKPYVTADPDIRSVLLDDSQDFFILACDGLWDYVSEQEAVVSVYQTIREHPGDLEAVSQGLVQLSKQQGSVDNISVIVVFLTDPAQLAAMDVWPTRDDAVTMDAATNPFQTNGSEPSYQKASLLLDLAGGEGYKHSAAPSETDLYFLNRPANGKGDASYEDDDFGPETDVDAVDDVLLSPAIAAAKAAAAAVAAGGVKQQLEADLELQRQQLSAFDPVREPREETPTPPADDVSGGPPLLPEAENVVESGEESEEEWNYFRVEPTEKPTAPQLPVETFDEDEASMESRLNPNAAEFVPSPTSTKPSMEELLSESPRKGGFVMDDMPVPSPVEFQQEVSLRPSELDLNPFAQSDISGNSLPDLLNGKTEQDNEKNPYQLLENESDLGELGEQLNPFKSSDHLFDKSEVSSTKAEYGDETSTSFVGNVSDGDYLMKAGDSNISAFMDLDASMTDSDFVAANVSSRGINEEEFKLSEDTLLATRVTDELTSCFELQKDLIPTMDSEALQLSPSNENVCSEVNSTPLNEELGLEDLVFSNPIHPTADSVLEFDNSSFNEVLDSTLPAELSGLSPNKDALDLTIDFTADPVVEHMHCSLPPFADINSSSLSSGIQNLLLESDTSFFVQQDGRPLSPVKTEPLVPEISNMVQFDAPPVLLHDCGNDTLIPQNDNTSSISQTEEMIIHGDSSIEVVEEFHHHEVAMDAGLPRVPSEMKIEDSVYSYDTIQPEYVAAAALATTASTAAAVAALSGNESASKEVKPAIKKTIADKGKSSPKIAPVGKSTLMSLQKASSKTTPTSPTKPMVSTPRSTSTPKKPTPVATSRVTSKVTTSATVTTRTTTTSKPTPMPNAISKVTSSSTTQVRVKVGSASPTKTAAPVKLAQTKTTAPLKPRPATSAATKAPGLSNGEAKPTARRIEPLAAKKILPAATNKPLVRPLSAPVATRVTKTSTVTRTTPVSAAPPKLVAKSAVNGVSKPKTMTTTTTLRAKPPTSISKSAVDKQVKDTANKQISSVTSKSSTLARTGMATTRKPQGVATKTTTTTTTVTKSSSGPIKRPAGTTITKTTTTSKIINAGATENEMVVVEEISSSVTKDDSPVIDNAQMEVMSSTN